MRQGFHLEECRYLLVMGDLNILTVVMTTVTGLLTFFLGQQRGKKEIESITLKNLEDSIGIYKTIIDDLRMEISLLNDKVSSLQNKVEELMQENHKLQKMLKK
jgi:peptidoglycan hydrolase CwlO-like protein